MTLRLIFRAHAPAIGVLLGAGALATGAGLAIAGHEAALIAVGGSNLSMVLALSGASLMLLMSAIWIAQDTKVRKDCGHPGNNSPLGFAVFLFLCSSIIGAGIYYGAIHHGVGAALALTSLTAEQSLLTQAGIAFAVSMGAFGLMHTSDTASKMTKRQQTQASAVAQRERRPAVAPVAPVTLEQAFKADWMQIILKSFGFSIAPTSALVGPVLSLYMGGAAATTAEAISMEVIISIGLPYAVFMTILAMTAGDINQRK
ncbi:MAG: hypothetical protein JSS50_02015 [Proteobacteria bacterium]|nr:hypothetical protein [Pseudomonadota bacterium]